MSGRTNGIAVKVRKTSGQAPNFSIVTPLTPSAPGYRRYLPTDRIEEMLQAAPHLKVYRRGSQRRS